MILPTAQKPAKRFCVILALCYFGGRGRNNVFGLRFARLSMITSSVLVLAHFMLPWTHLLYLGWHTSCYVGHIFCNAVRTLHVTFDTSSVIRFAHFMLRWTRLLFLGSRISCHVGQVLRTLIVTPCYVGQVVFNSVITLHVTLDTSSVLRLANFVLDMFSVLRFANFMLHW